MKKNYYMVLVALFSFALNAFAQEDKWEAVTSSDATETQGNAYNMVITLPGGTTFTVNTDDVDEVQFSNGQVTVSGASIQQLLNYCEKIQAEQDKLLGTVHALVTDESVLHVLLEDNKRAYEELQDYVKDLANHPDVDLSKYVTKDDLYTILSDLNTRLNTLECNFSILCVDVQEALRTARESYAKVQSNEALLNNFKNEQAALMSKDAAQDAEINDQMTMIATLKGIISDLLDRVQKLESK